MPNVTLLHSPTCGACPSAKRVWKELRVKYSFSYREVDITTTDGQERPIGIQSELCRRPLSMDD